jgi:ribosome maturation factor RimP
MWRMKFSVLKISVFCVTFATYLLSTGSLSPPRCNVRDSVDRITGAGYKSALRTFRSGSCLYVKKRKDNRKYVASPKEDDDEPDDDYFEELAEDVKALLRSSPTLPIKESTAPEALLEVEPLSVGSLLVDDVILDEEEEVSPADLFAEFSAMLDDESNGNFVTSLDDIVSDEEEGEGEEEGSVRTGILPDDYKGQVETIIRQIIQKQGLFVQKIFWAQGRIEVVISASDDVSNPIGPSVSALSQCHRSMYDEFELREEELAVVTKFEILVASPGIGEVLRSDQDFVSFKGFTVTVSTTEIYRKKTLFEGTLVERNADDVCISLKGRILKIPRTLINQVKLPKPKYESTDTEMRKIR